MTLAVRERDGQQVTTSAQDGSELRMLPIVPLVGEAARRVPSPQPIDGARVDLDALDKLVHKRLEAVGKKLIDTELGPVTNAAHRWALRAG